MTSSGRLISTEKIGCTMPRLAGASVVVAAAAANRQYQRSHGGADGGGDQRRFHRFFGYVAPGCLGILAQLPLRRGRGIAHAAGALAGEIRGAVTQVAHLLAGPVQRLAGELLGAFERVTGGAERVVGIAGSACTR